AERSQRAHERCNAYVVDRRDRVSQLALHDLIGDERSAEHVVECSPWCLVSIGYRRSAACTAHSPGIRRQLRSCSPLRTECSASTRINNRSNPPTRAASSVPCAARLEKFRCGRARVLLDRGLTCTHTVPRRERSDIRISQVRKALRVAAALPPTLHWHPRQLGPGCHRSTQRRTRSDPLRQCRGGRSTGSVPDTSEGMAEHVLPFLDGLRLPTCDVLGYS
ncbi:MAG: hypothetical protein JWP01_3783, partial [Myxococcales bacterium]|nr:hypothetical protein [Myxococcales bacterium]